jgi:hypothetical protein
MQAQEMRYGAEGNRLMSMPISDDVRAEVLDAWDRHDQLDCGAKGLKVRLHLRIDRRHGGLESIDLIEMKAQQEAMVFGHPAAKGLTQFLR